MIRIISQPYGIKLDSDNLIFDIQCDTGNTIKFFSDQITMGLNVPKYSNTSAHFNIKGLFRTKSNFQTNSVSTDVQKIENLFSLTGKFVEYKNGQVISEVAITPIQILYSSKTINKLNHSILHFLNNEEDLITDQQAYITIPFFIKEKQKLILKITDQKGVLLLLNIIDSAEPGTYLITFIKKLDYNVESLLVSIQGIYDINKKIRVLKNTSNKPINIRFVNQYGIQIYTQLFANISITEELKNTTYRNQNGKQFVSDIESTSNIEIDTGYLLQSELGIISQIVNSTNVEIELNGIYHSVVTTTKKVTQFVNNQFITTNKITFQKTNYEAY